MSVLVLRGDARRLPLPGASVDLIVCSPPYFSLRDYRDGDGSLAGQIGSEATPQEWLAALVECTREWVRVLKPEGSMFINLGDKYDSGTTTGRINPGTIKDGQGQGWHRGTPRVSLGQPKCLLGLPWRYAIACTDQLGLILRAEIVWAKPNGLPESVNDRVRRAHEQIFHLVKQPRYYSATDEIREPQADPRTGSNGRARDFHTDQLSRKWNPSQNAYNPLGKLPGSVWPIPPVRDILQALARRAITAEAAEQMLMGDPWAAGVWSIPSQPLQVPARLGIQHFAAFPIALPRRIIAGWSPPGVCVACGEGRRPVVDKQLENVWHDKPLQNSRYHGTTGQHQHNRMGQERAFGSTAATITGYACACPTPDAPTRPAVVLDPFSGTGTTLLAAEALGRVGVGVDLSHDYARLARWRVNDPAERAKAWQVPKPPPVVDGQEALFSL